MKSIFYRRHSIAMKRVNLTATQVITSFAFSNKGEKPHLPLIRFNIGLTHVLMRLRPCGGMIFIT